MAGSGIQNSVSGSRRINSKASASVIPGRVEFCPRIAEKRRALCEEEKIRYGTRGATTLKRDSLHSPLKPRLAIVPPQWQTRENGFNFRVPEPSRAVAVVLLFRRVTTITRSASPSTRATPAIPLLECCRAHSFQLWSSASSLRIRWNELALRNRKASLPPFVLSPSLSNPSTLLSPPPLSLSFSLSFSPPRPAVSPSFPRARTVAVSLPESSFSPRDSFVRAIQRNAQRVSPTTFSRLNRSTQRGSNDPIFETETISKSIPISFLSMRRIDTVINVITIPIVINSA